MPATLDRILAYNDPSTEGTLQGPARIICSNSICRAVYQSLSPGLWLSDLQIAALLTGSAEEPYFQGFGPNVFLDRSSPLATPSVTFTKEFPASFL